MIFKMAWNNITHAKSRSILTILILSVGMIFYILMTGILGGLVNMSLDNIIDLDTGHIKIKSTQYDEDFPYSSDNLFSPTEALNVLNDMAEVKGVTTRVLIQADIDNSIDKLPIILTGIDFEQDENVFTLLDYTDYKELDNESVLIGSQLAEDLEVGIGDLIYLTFQNKKGGYVSLAMQIKDTLSVPDTKTLSSGVIVSKDFLQNVLEVDDITEITVLLKDEYTDLKSINKFEKKLQKKLPNYRIENWQDNATSFLAAKKLDTTFIDILVLVLALIAAIGLINTLLLSVYEKRRELAMLKAMGFTKDEIIRLVTDEALIICITGFVVGTIVGLLLNMFFAFKGVDFSTVLSHGNDAMELPYRIYGYVKSIWNFSGIIKAFILIIVVGLLASVYPGMKAAKIQVAEALRK